MRRFLINAQYDVRPGVGTAAPPIPLGPIRLPYEMVVDGEKRLAESADAQFGAKIRGKEIRLAEVRGQRAGEIRESPPPDLRETR